MDSFELLPSLAQGDLGETSAPEMVAAVFRARASGTLVLERPGVVDARIFFRAGDMCGAAEFPEFRPLASILLANEWIDGPTLERTRHEAMAARRRHGELLMERKLVTAQQLRLALAAQHRHNLATLLQIHAGRYDWRGTEPPPAWAREVVVEPLACIIDALEHPRQEARRARILKWLGQAQVRLSGDWAELQARVAFPAADVRAMALCSRALLHEEFVARSGLTRARADALLCAVLLAGGLEALPPVPVSVAASAPPAVTVAAALVEPDDEVHEPFEEAVFDSEEVERAFAGVPPLAAPVATATWVKDVRAPLPPPPPLASDDDDLALAMAVGEPAPTSYTADKAARQSGVEPMGRAPSAGPPRWDVPHPPGDASSPAEVAAPVRATPAAEAKLQAQRPAAEEPLPEPRPLTAQEEQEAHERRLRLLARGLRNLGGPRVPTGDTGPLGAPAGSTRPLRVPTGDTGPVRVPTGDTGPVRVPTGDTGPVRVPTGDTGPLRVPTGDTGPLGRAAAAAQPAATSPAAGQSDRFVQEVRDRLNLAPSQDAYARLGLTRGAVTNESVKAAFHEAAKKFHPDRATGPAAVVATELQQLFGLLKDAYDDLATDEQRKRLAAGGRSASQPTGPVSRKEDSAVLIKMGDVLVKKRDFEGALHRLRRAVELDASADSLAALAWAMLADPRSTHAQHEEAASLAQKSLRTAQPTARAYYVAGVCARAEKPTAAESYFRKALDLEPKHAEAAVELRLLETRRKHGSDAGGPPKRKP